MDAITNPTKTAMSEQEIKEAIKEIVKTYNEYSHASIYKVTESLLALFEQQAAIRTSGLEAEVLRLRGLIETAFKDSYKAGRVHPSNNMNKDWQQFKQTNNI